MLPVTVMFSVNGVDRRRFLDYVAENPTTYRDWGLAWDTQKGGKEDDLFSPYLEKPFARARAEGVIPPGLKSIGGTWSTITDAGEATYLNMIHLTGYDGTDVHDLTRAEIEGRAQALQAIKALNQFAPGFEHARLRTYGMTRGGARHAQDRGALRPDRARRAQPGALRRFDRNLPRVHRRLRRAGAADDRPLLPGALRRAGSRCACENLLVAGRCIAGDAISHASVRSMMCCAVIGQGAGVAAAVSIKDGVTVRDVSVAHVQAELRRQGARLS